VTLAGLSAIWSRVRAWVGPVLGALAAIALYVAGRRAGRRDERGEGAERKLEAQAEIARADARAEDRHAARVEAVVARDEAEPASGDADLGELFARARRARERALRVHGR
jgi:hypothetical protein